MTRQAKTTPWGIEVELKGQKVILRLSNDTTLIVSVADILDAAYEEPRPYFVN
jgi:hypothetical protein